MVGRTGRSWVQRGWGTDWSEGVRGGVGGGEKQERRSQAQVRRRCCGKKDGPRDFPSQKREVCQGLVPAHHSPQASGLREPWPQALSSILADITPKAAEGDF